jgi:hypothetical protein
MKMVSSPSIRIARRNDDHFADFTAHSGQLFAKQTVAAV